MPIRYVCFHGHFYQPPREDPWLKRIERQASAYPYHDWDERVHHECYRPNAEAVILNNQGQISERLNNYEFMSFNFGPTLLSWIENFDPETYEKILQADRNSLASNDGHGSAMAQVYNHVIMPLASRRDKELQVRWGLEDFRHRFRREAEGIWLAETAVDLETLEILCDFNVKFTILSPTQANAEGLDVTRPYWVNLPSGRKIAVFFYDSQAARGVAFGGWLNNGEGLAERVLEPLSRSSSKAPLALVATDGESYGHHHKMGEMALAYAVRKLQADSSVRLTNLAAYLEKFPPESSIELHCPSAWSCAHGVERWRSNCGCRMGTQFLDQSWRTPLRQALSDLKSEIAQFVDLHISKDPDLKELVLKLPMLFHDSGGMNLTSKVRQIMEMERASQYMMTSCAWFFDDAAGLEVQQNLKFAARALEIYRNLGGPADAAERKFEQVLASAHSHAGRFPHAAALYQSEIKTLKKSLSEIAVQEFLNRRLNLAVRFSDLFQFEMQEVGALDGAESWKLRIHDLESAEESHVGVIYVEEAQLPLLYFTTVREEVDSLLSLASNPNLLRELRRNASRSRWGNWSRLTPASMSLDLERSLLLRQITDCWSQWRKEYARVFQPNEGLSPSDPIWNLTKTLSDLSPH